MGRKRIAAFVWLTTGAVLAFAAGYVVRTGQSVGPDARTGAAPIPSAPTPDEAAAPPVPGPDDVPAASETWIDVELDPAAAWPHGVLYALPRGARGQDDLDALPHVETEPGRTLYTLRVPTGRRHDVGFVPYAEGWHVLQEDGVGDVGLDHVLLRRPATEAVRLRVTEPWPERPGTPLSIAYVTDDGPADDLVAFPGRGQRRRFTCAKRVEGHWDEIVCCPVAVGQRVLSGVELLWPSGDGDEAPRRQRLRLLGEPDPLGTGRELALRFVHVVQLVVVASALPPPEGVRHAGWATEVTFSLHPGSGFEGMQTVDLSGGRPPKTLYFLVPPGEYTLLWHGPHAERGRLDAVVVPESREPVDAIEKRVTVQLR